MIPTPVWSSRQEITAVLVRQDRNCRNADIRRIHFEIDADCIESILPPHEVRLRRIQVPTMDSVNWRH
ncbi:MAG: hypothetical protein DMG15_09945 [Acidobacteria bacterium]|nr:MAG: hypothetical protein DMG15_09945 [Acidobacteriota bacterium]